MLPKSHRLPHSVRLSNARSLRTDLFVIKSAFNSLGTSRFGVVISKKVDKRAVGRNRMRRLANQAILTHFLPISKSQDTLFIVQKPFAQLPEQLLEEVVIFFKKATL